MSNINQELQHQLEVMRSQKNISIDGDIHEVNNYLQALSRVYELAADVAEMERKMDEIKAIAMACANNLNIDFLSFSMGTILGVINRDSNNKDSNSEAAIKLLIEILKPLEDKNAKAIIIEEWVQKNGPFPNKYGEIIRSMLE